METQKPVSTHDLFVWFVRGLRSGARDLGQPNPYKLLASTPAESYVERNISWVCGTPQSVHYDRDQRILIVDDRKAEDIFRIHFGEAYSSRRKDEPSRGFHVHHYFYMLDLRIHTRLYLERVHVPTAY